MKKEPERSWKMEKKNTAQFINPYHFIQLAEAPEREQEKPGKIYTGYVEYSLTTRSNLFIPNTSSSRAFRYEPNRKDDPEDGHTLYDFFSYENLEPEETYDDKYFEPVIPGSEIRGMLRSIYETLTNSCLSVLDGDRKISKRTVERFKPGVLKREEDGSICLYNAKDIILRNRKDFSVKMAENVKIPDGTQVYYTLLKEGNKRGKAEAKAILTEEGGGSSKYRGYLMKGNTGPEILANAGSMCKSKCGMKKEGKCSGYQANQTEQPRCYLAEKHCVHIFDTYGCKKLKQITKESLDTLEVVLKEYLKKDESSYQEYQNAYHNFLTEETDGLPVYYSEIEDLDYIFLSPACITKEAYRNTVHTLTKNYQKCNSGERKLCPACRLFGIVNSKAAKGSKVRFTDLLPSKKLENAKGYYEEALWTLAPLAVPHPEATEFYLKKPVNSENPDDPVDPEGEVWFWTYDYYTVKVNGQIIVKRYCPKISGRKYYWNNLSEYPGDQKKTGLNKTVRVLKRGIEFTGRIYFDGISEKQLEQLIYLLNFTSDGRHGYKLGMGKPLGLGSVQLSIEGNGKVVTRRFDEKGYGLTEKRREEIHEIQKKGFKELGFEPKVKGQFELMTRYLEPSVMKKIQYPTTGKEEKEGEGFQWFQLNRKYYSKKKDEEGFKPAKMPSKRIQTKINQALPEIEEGKIPWLWGERREEGEI